MNFILSLYFLALVTGTIIGPYAYRFERLERNHFQQWCQNFDKEACVFPVVVVSIMSHAEFGRNGHREYAPHFTGGYSYSGFYIRVKHLVTNLYTLCASTSHQAFQANIGYII